MVDVCEKFCVLRLRHSWFAIPAMAVREVFPRPSLVSVPGTPPIIEGICHRRTEFLPVLRLAALVGEEDWSPDDDQQQVLVLGTSGGTMGLLVNHVVALESLEVAVNDDQHDRWSVIMGSANFHDHVVRVLDHTALVRRAQSWLNEYWQNEQALFSTAANGAREMFP